MRVIWLIFGVLLAAILVGGWFHRHSTAPAARPMPAALPVVAVAERRPALAPLPSARADSIVRFALAQVGTNYLYAGTSPSTGFDCSGFLLYVFRHFGVATPHSTALLIDVGQPVPRSQARPGDIVVFTGTAATSTTPGHAGIVISALGETPLRFVHASSARRESGVKISQVEGSDYERRFMQVRRVLGPGGSSPAVVAARPQRATARPVTAVPTLPPLTAEAVLPLPPPMRVVPLPVRLRMARRPAVAHAAKPTSTKLTKSKAPLKPAAHQMAPGRRPTAKAKPKAPHPAVRQPMRRRQPTVKRKRK